MKKILFIFGTRPEAIKLAPLINLFKKQKMLKTKICVTSQHRSLLKKVLNLFNIRPDYDLNIMTSNQSIENIIIKISKKLSLILKKINPDLIIVQGDTTSAMIGGLIASMHKIKVAHIEAGLRTFDNSSPWPEEINRNLISKISSLNFCPTKTDYKNLKKENIKNIYLTGNTIIDAVDYILKNPVKSKERLFKNKYKNYLNKKNKIFLTVHRRENFKLNLKKIIKTILKLSNQNINFFIPVHPNPNIKKEILKNLKNKNNIFLSKPISFDEGIFLMKNSDVILSDSGGIQEEVTVLKKKILILRNTTERPDVLKNFGKLVGSDSNKISKNILYLLKRKNNLHKISSPFGKIGVAKKILKIIKKNL